MLIFTVSRSGASEAPYMQELKGMDGRHSVVILFSPSLFQDHSTSSYMQRKVNFFLCLVY
jgi:hypothetical protein